MRYILVVGLLPLFTLALARPAQAVSISSIRPQSSSVRVYEKYEVRFDVATGAKHLFFEYDPSPPAGVASGTGITVEGIVTTPSGKQLTHPAFYQREVRRVGSGDSMYFEETSRGYWTLRFAPQEVGMHRLRLRATDASGTVTVSAGAFTATAPTRPGFIGVSPADPRYFAFSDGSLFWPMGPAWTDNRSQSANPNARNYDISQYAGTGINFYRPWMAGIGAYSANFARWLSSADWHGNEGIMMPLTHTERAPGSELSYMMKLPEGYRIWIGRWGNDLFAFRMKSACYRAQVTLKIKNLNAGSFVIKPFAGWPEFKDDHSRLKAALAANPAIIPPQTQNRDWHTVTTVFLGRPEYDNLFLYFDGAATSGEVYIDAFSLREITSPTSCTDIRGDETLGGELIRNPKADIHTYVDARGAAYFDWLLEEGEQYGVYYKLVVHDKNDWVQNHLRDGQWVPGDRSWGYYQGEFDESRGQLTPFSMKAGWLRKQWYRYLAARWGYSTAVHSWELNNEGPPGGADTYGDVHHFATAQNFAQYMRRIDAHPHLATTSFWCCWRPSFWGNRSGLYPDIGYADLHNYAENSEETGHFNYTDDPVRGVLMISDLIGRSHIGKPTVISETGLSDRPWLTSPNDGAWWRKMQWAHALHPAAVSSPGYWFSEHLRHIDREQISTVLKNFLSTVEWHKGGFVDAQASSSFRVVGKKHMGKGCADLWVENNGAGGSVTLTLKPNTGYTVELWNTKTGSKTTQVVIGDAAGRLTIPITGGYPETGVKICPRDSAARTPPGN